MRKQGGKSGNLVDEKPPKFDEKMRIKTDDLQLYVFALVKNFQNLTLSMGIQI